VPCGLPSRHLLAPNKERDKGSFLSAPSAPNVDGMSWCLEHFDTISEHSVLAMKRSGKRKCRGSSVPAFTAAIATSAARLVHRREVTMATHLMPTLKACRDIVSNGAAYTHINSCRRFSQTRKTELQTRASADQQRHSMTRLAASSWQCSDGCGKNSE